MEEPKAKQPPHIDPRDLKMPGEIFDDSQPHTARWLLIALVFVLAAILIGLIVWMLSMQSQPAPVTPSATRPSAEENNEPESTTAEAAVDTLQAMSPSTEISSIEADLNATFINELDGDFADIEATFESGAQ